MPRFKDRTGDRYGRLTVAFGIRLDNEIRQESR